MTLWTVLAGWVIVSLVLTLLWLGYRRFVGTHALEEFDLPPRESPAVTRGVFNEH